MMNNHNFFLVSITHLQFSLSICSIESKEVHPMLKKKHYLYLDKSEHSLLVKSLVQMKNRLIKEGRFTDCVDDLLMKVIAAPMKRI